jgi:UDP-N-acetylglucosamine acyltransferase
VSPEAELADGVEVGAFALVEGPVRLGPGCVVRPRAHLVGPLVMGRGNLVGPGAVLGERPQHLRHGGATAGVSVGDGNSFGARATVHASTDRSAPTRVGDGNRLLAGAHVGHDCRVGGGCALGRRALLAGHGELADGASVGDGAAVHQFCRLGRLAALAGGAITTKDVPPFVAQRGANAVAGLNAPGLRRAGLGARGAAAVRRAYRAVFLRGLALPEALALVEAELGGVAAVREFVAFVRASARGINRARAPRPPRPAPAGSARGPSPH